MRSRLTDAGQQPPRSPLDGIRSIAFLAKGLACSSVCRLSFGSDIHSRMILLVFRLHVKILCPNGRRGQHKGRAVMRKDRCREVNAPARRSLQMLSSYPAPFWLAGGVF
jgi:hypothetical protein